MAEKILALPIAGDQAPFSITGKNTKANATYKINSDGSGQVQLLIDFLSNMEEITQPEKKQKIYFQTNQNGTIDLDITELTVMPATGNHTVQLTVKFSAPGKIKDTTALKVGGGQGATGSNLGTAESSPKQS